MWKTYLIWSQRLNFSIFISFGDLIEFPLTRRGSMSFCKLSLDVELQLLQALWPLKRSSRSLSYSDWPKN